MTELHIPANEHGRIRVFAVNRPKADMAETLKSEAHPDVIADLLGRAVPETAAELVAVGDLTGVGLSGYLSDGLAVPEDRIAPDRAKLDSLDGYVLIVFSTAFEGEETTLTPGPDLTLIGTYGEAQPDMSSVPLDSEAAQPYTGVPRQTPTQPPGGRPGGAMMVLGLLVIAALVLWWLL